MKPALTLDTFSVFDRLSNKNKTFTWFLTLNIRLHEFEWKLTQQKLVVSATEPELNPAGWAKPYGDAYHMFDAFEKQRIYSWKFSKSQKK